MGTAGEVVGCMFTDADLRSHERTSRAIAVEASAIFSSASVPPSVIVSHAVAEMVLEEQQRNLILERPL